jgi:TatD DNase family protein
MNYWTDAHCHLQERYLSEDRGVQGDISDALNRAYEAGVDRVVVVGTDAHTSQEALAVTDIESAVSLYATVGLHPHEATSDLTPIEELARSGHPRLVAIGECGLDYYYEHSPRDVQRVAFARQIALAVECDLALVIHARDAFDDLFDIFRSEGVPPRTVIHCFTGTPAEADACLSFGCDISLAGVVTFKNAESLRDAAKIVPIDRLHVETDAPFLAPVPHRGRANEPAYVPLVGEFVAHLRGDSIDEIRRATAANTARLFQIS